MDRTFRTILIVFLVVAALSVGVVVVSMRNIQRAAKASDWVNHTHAFITEVDGIVASLRHAEGALHTYLLTRSELQRDDYRDAFAELAEHVEVAKALAASNEANAAHIATLEAALGQRAQLARDLLNHQRAGEDDAVQELLTSDAAADGLQELLRQAHHIRAQQIEALNQRDQAAYAYDQTSRTTLFIGASLNVLILLGTAWFIRDDLNARRRATALLQSDNERLEARVAERTAELSEANTKLKAENLESRWKNQALGHQLRYNHLIIDSINELVLVITKARNISRVNPAVLRATGLEMPDLVDRPLSDCVALDAPPDGAPLLDPVKDALRSGQDLRDRPAALKDKNGDPVPVRFSLYPLRDNDKVVGGVVTLHLVSTGS
ncbi:CHASE3 domain-containing protein [Actomonas aquatica]|uniref:CHASE3 domain-containing protein n=1 Tax=Actomonas aquatica TaxID=2866162 RepID=A0ABZ1C9M8_9BACT|nr:CHASE3 domain-containing protein [Opitutus sp. WL0086]WRQ87015.1 CHASE3 domain-containing protein [Opitutus sp. WL0086]